MKKSLTIITFVFSLVSLSLLLQNCAKESSVQTSSNNTKSAPGWGIHNHLITDFPEMGDIWCGAPSIDCFDDVVIKSGSAAYSVYTQLETAESNNTIPSFFSNSNYAILFPGLSTENVNNIITGDFNIVSRESTVDPGTKIWIVLDGNASIIDFDVDHDVIYAMPIKLE